MNMESFVSRRALTHPGLSLGKALPASHLICVYSGKVDICTPHQDTRTIVLVLAMPWLVDELVNGSLFLSGLAKMPG